MKERPILFSGEMVRAILAGTKTQTRRVVKPPKVLRVFTIAADGAPPGDWGLADADGDAVDVPLRCPYGVPGDRLWVRETWARLEDPEASPPIAYRADYDPPGEGDYGLWKRRDRAKEWFCGAWSPSIHMPRWASRITLEVVSVRVERLQAITEEDARAEGVTPVAGMSRGTFALTWGLINGKRAGASWGENPWVWRIEFRRVER